MLDVSAVPQPRASYDSYIRLQTLLSCQAPVSAREDEVTWQAERFFIVSHQMSELWLSQILLDLDQAVRLSAPPVDWPEIRTLLTRAASMTSLLCRLLEQLVSLCPRRAFLAFRPLLQGLSACESMQFRELLQVGTGVHPGMRKLETALAEIGGDSDSQRVDARKSMRALVQGVVLWRKFHVAVASHFLADLPGTGYSSGVDYLAKRANSDETCPESFEKKLDDLERDLRHLASELRDCEASMVSE
jgi:tryptophan 2,3-dioxygenase